MMTISKTGPDPATVADDNPWTLSVAHDTKLLQGMESSDPEAATQCGLGSTAEPHLDDDLIDKLRE
jgi:hypothetical protein